MDIQAAETQVKAYLLNEDPQTQLADMAAITAVFEPLTLEESATLAERSLTGLPPDDKRDLFVMLAKRLSAEQLIGVSLGLRNDAAGSGDLRNAIDSFSPPFERTQFELGMTLVAVQLSQAPDNHDIASAREQAFLKENLQAGHENDPHEMYRLFMLDPKAMSQRVINQHCKEYPQALQLNGRTEISNEIGRALGWSRETPDAARSAVIDKLLEIGGDSVKVTVLPVVYAVDGEKASGIAKTALFKLTDKEGDVHFVDELGRDYDSLDDYRNNNGLPAEGVTLAMPEDGKVSRDADGNVRLLIADARIEGSLESFRRATHADLVLAGIGFGAGTVVILAATGLVAVPAGLLTVAGGALFGASGWGVGISANNLIDRGTHGQTVNPVNSSEVALDYLNGALSLAGMGELATLGHATRLTAQAGNEVRLAGRALEAGAETAHDIHLARAVVLSQQAQTPARIGQAAFTPTVQKVLLTGNAVAFGASGYQLHEGWETMSPGQRAESILMLTLNAGGFGLNSAGKRVASYLDGAEPPPLRRDSTAVTAESLPSELRSTTETTEAAASAEPGTAEIPSDHLPEKAQRTAGRYDTTLTALGSQQNHVLGGVEAAAQALQGAQSVTILVGSKSAHNETNSDGFTGASELGLALQSSGMRVNYVVQDQAAAQAMRGVLADLGRPVSRGQNEVVVFDPANAQESRRQARFLLNEFKTDHVVAVDVPGRTADGVYTDAQGNSISDANVPLDEIVRVANRRELVTIGIGSDGNEVGMPGAHPEGEGASTVTTQYSVTAWNSSLGAQALSVELHRLNESPLQRQPSEWQRETAFSTLLRLGATDEGAPGGASGVTPGIKGYPPEVHAAMAKLLESQAGKPPGQIGYRFNAGEYRVVAAFDSSNGGILAAGNLAAALQNANVGPVRFVVVVDHGNAPYGRKDPITQLPGLVNNALTAAEGIGPATGGRGDIQVIAMACNTACTPTKTVYAKGVEVPVIDLIDTTVNEILDRGGNHPVSISTVTTAQSHAYGDGVANAVTLDGQPSALTSRSASPTEGIFRWDSVLDSPSRSGVSPLGPRLITEIGAPSWADIVNKLEHQSQNPGAMEYVTKEIRTIVDQVPEDATSVWLTCTHYPALKPLIESALHERGLNVEVIDPMASQAVVMADALGESSSTAGSAPGDAPPMVILTTGSPSRNVAGSAQALSGRSDALVFHVPSFDPSSPELADVQAYMHDALSSNGSPYDPLLVSFNSRSIAALHDNGRVEAAAVATRNANSVMILTNFNVAEGMPETDGPPGAAALGHAYSTVGKDVVYVVSDEPARTVLRAALAAYGDGDARIEVFNSTTDEAGKIRADHMLKSIKPDAVVAVEVPARTDVSGPVNMRGVPISSFNSPMYQLTLAANRTKGLVTVGIFDGGNEIGAGNVKNRVPLALDGETVMASNIQVDYHVAAWNSNFGADTLAIEVLRQHGMLDYAHTSQELVASIEATLQAGAVDGVTRGGVSGERVAGGETGVDGFAPWVHGVMHDLQIRSAHERPAPNATFPVGPHDTRPSGAWQPVGK